jgi:DNA-binding MarR family transcriptional regulator
MMIDKNYHTGVGHSPSKKNKLEEISPGFLINSAALSLKKHFSQALSASGYRISTEQYAVLSQLWNENGLYQSDLGKRVFKDRHNISRIIKSLERKALVIKKADENDARLTRCVLTKKGSALRAPLTRISARVLKGAFQGMREEEIRKLKKTLIHLLRNLEETPFQ